VRRVDEARVGQREQLRPQRVVEHAAEVAAGPAGRGEQIRPPDVADEQRVAREHGVRRGVACAAVVDDDRDRLGRMAGRFQDHQPDARAEVDDVAVVQRRGGVFGLRRLADVDRGAGPIAQLEVPGDEVGVEVRQEDVRDAQAVLGRHGDVLIDVTLRIDNGSHARRLVADEVRRVREALQVELLEDHSYAVFRFLAPFAAFAFVAGLARSALTGFFFSALTESRLRRSASIRSTTRGGSCTSGATISSPAILASMICRSPSWYSSLYSFRFSSASKVAITCFASFISSGFTLLGTEFSSSI
jgi:hypothetical protein